MTAKGFIRAENFDDLRRTKMKRISIIILLTIFAATPAFTQEDLICGSLEKFNQTKRWEDLPGCAKYSNYDDENKTLMILAQTKRKFEEFFTRWIAEREFGTDGYGLPWHYKNSIKDFIDERDAARWSADPQLVAAKPAFEEMRRIAEQHLALKDSYPLIKSLSQDFSTVKALVNEMTGKDVGGAGKGAIFSPAFVQGLEESLAKVVAAGVPDSTVITAYDKKTYTLGEIKADASRLVATRKGAADKLKAAEEEKWRPFTSVLKGDRLAHFNRYRDSYEFKGIGGRILRTPADFQNTPIMAALSIDDNGVVIRWELTIWRFQGDKLIGRQTKSGWGRSAPSSAYR